MIMQVEILPTVGGRSLDAIKLGKNKGECSKIVYDNHSDAGKQTFLIDEDGAYLVHLFMNKSGELDGRPNVYKALGPHPLVTVYDVINGIVPYLEDQIWNFEFDIND